MLLGCPKNPKLWLKKDILLRKKLQNLRLLKIGKQIRNSETLSAAH